MDYINTSYNESHLLSALKSAQGMQAITDILAESQAYKKLKDENKRDDKLSFSENKTQYMNTLQIKFSDIPKEYFLKLNDLYTNPSKFWELYQ